MLLADEPSLGAVVVAIDYDAGRRGVNAELVFDSRAAEVVAWPKRSVRVDEELRRQKQRQAPRSRRGAGQTGENEMDDILRHVVLAVGDEDLLAEQAIGAVRPAFRAGPDRGEVRASLRFGEIHRPAPTTADHRRKIDVEQLARAERMKRVDGAFGQERAERK